MSRELQSALPNLLLAHDCARDVDAEVWDFAVELSTLCESGLTIIDLRWLVMKGYVEHRDEHTLPGQSTRNFRTASRLTFGDSSCFILTEVGTEFARNLLAGTSATRAANGAGDRKSRDDEGNGQIRCRLVDRMKNITDADDRAPLEGRSDLPEPATPYWDPHRRELRFMGCVVKQFKLPAPTQEMLLNAFDEDGWPPRIDDPLPPEPDQDAKVRLNNTIKSLNRNQRHRLVRFMGDGTGEGILWESLAENLVGDAK